MAIIITKPIEEHRQEVITKINEITGKVILGKYPQYKQTNMLTRYQELLSSGEQYSTEGLDITKAWDWIKSCVACSNKWNTEVLTATNVVTLREIEQNFNKELEELCK